MFKLFLAKPLGIVDSSIKSSGIFASLFKQTIERTESIEMDFCIYDFVTNHDYSQRLVSRYGTHELAIFIGSQMKETQVNMEKLGIGKNPEEMDRYSILLAIGQFGETPFGSEVVLPPSLGEMASFLLEPLGISWKPTSRFSSLSAKGSYRTVFQEDQKAVIFDLIEPGYEALKKISQEWKYLLRKGFQYAGVEVSMKHDGFGLVHDFLGRKGFFIGGFIPYHRSNDLGFRFQALAPTRVAIDEIKLWTDHGRELLKMIREDYERNSFT